MENLDLYQLAEHEGIGVYSHKMDNGSSSAQVNGEYCIAIDSCVFDSSDVERVHLAHELGHCITGSFYNPYSGLDIMEKHERRATVWAYKRIVPLDGIHKCFMQGLTEPWQMEDVFDVPAWFIRQAMEYYQNVRPMA